MSCEGTGMNGTDVTLWIDGTCVGSQRNVTFTETNDEIDVSSKESRHQRVLAGRGKATVSLEHLYVPDDTAYLALLAARRNGTFVEVIRHEDGATLESACAIVTSLSTAAPDQDGVVVSCDLTIDGEWTAGS